MLLALLLLGLLLLLFFVASANLSSALMVSSKEANRALQALKREGVKKYPTVGSEATFYRLPEWFVVESAHAFGQFLLHDAYYCFPWFQQIIVCARTHARHGTAPHRTAPRHRTAPHRTTRHRTAPHHGTAPHGAAPHGAAPHRTAPHRAAPHRTARAGIGNWSTASSQALSNPGASASFVRLPP